MPVQAAAPLEPWTPPVQGRPVTLPAFDAPAAPVTAAPRPATAAIAPAAPVAQSPASPSPEPAQANPFAQPAKANPFAQPAAANPFAQPALANQLAEQAHENPFAHPMQPNPFAEPAQPHPFVRPIPASPVAAPVLASPALSQAELSPVAPALEPTPTPIAPVVYASHSERPVYTSPFEPREDVNPIVRPQPSTLEHPTAEAPLQVHTSESVQPVVEAAPIAAPQFTAPVIPEPVLPEPPIAEARVEAPVQASSVELPVVPEPVAEAAPSASAFETAPTEFAASETPISDVEAARAETHAAEAVPELGPEVTAAELTPVATPPSANAESVIGESEIQEQAPIAQPFPALAPARSFTSSGSEMPVVITTPAPHKQDSMGPSSNLFGLGREFLPRAQAWSKKNLRENPRALVIAAPLVALLGIWGIRSAVSHPKHATNVEASAELAAQPQTATPALPSTAAASPAAVASAILVSASAAPAAPAATADAAELASATSHGLPALEALAQKFPADTQVGLALASQQAQAQRFEAALASIERVISVDAKSAQNGKVAGILWRAAQSDASEASFSTLRKLGGRGADVTFDLASTAGVRDSVRERAKTELTKSLSPEASTDTRVASALLLAPDCASRKALLGRAEHEGGKRTQVMLERISRGSACSSNSDKACNACLTGSAELSKALSQLNTQGQK